MSPYLLQNFITSGAKVPEPPDLLSYLEVEGTQYPLHTFSAQLPLANSPLD
jgi:hypothetical protein